MIKILMKKTLILGMGCKKILYQNLEAESTEIFH